MISCVITSFFSSSLFPADSSQTLFMLLSGSGESVCWRRVESHYGTMYRGSHPPWTTLLLERADSHMHWTGFAPCCSSVGILRDPHAKSTTHHRVYELPGRDLLLEHLLIISSVDIWSDFELEIPTDSVLMDRCWWNWLTIELVWR